MEVAGGEKGEDDVHLIVEYKRQGEWDGVVSLRANRFIVHHDLNNPLVSSLEQFSAWLRPPAPGGRGAADDGQLSLRGGPEGQEADGQELPHHGRGVHGEPGPGGQEDPLRQQPAPDLLGRGGAQHQHLPRPRPRLLRGCPDSGRRR